MSVLSYHNRDPKNCTQNLQQQLTFFRIGVSEKGWLTLDLEVEGPAGHSSIPPKNSAVSRLSKALVALEDNPQPSMFGRGPEADMLAYIAPKVSWVNWLRVW